MTASGNAWIQRVTGIILISFGIQAVPPGRGRIGNIENASRNFIRRTWKPLKAIHGNYSQAAVADRREIYFGNSDQQIENARF